MAKFLEPGISSLTLDYPCPSPKCVVKYSPKTGAPINRSDITNGTGVSLGGYYRYLWIGKTKTRGTDLIKITQIMKGTGDVDIGYNQYSKWVSWETLE